MVLGMKKINKSCKAPYSGVLLTTKEAENYKKYLENKEEVKRLFNDYVEKYYSVLM